MIGAPVGGNDQIGLQVRGNGFYQYVNLNLVSALGVAKCLGCCLTIGPAIEPGGTCLTTVPLEQISGIV